MQENKEEFKSSRGDALRYNKGKLRYDLIHPDAHKDLVSVLTMGAMKYSPNNWRLGFAWSSVIASLKRHIAAFEIGEDYDPESGELHIAHAACNVHFLNAYYYIFPQGDDRQKKIFNTPRIGLDIDCVIADFCGAWHKLYPEVPANPVWWNYDRKMSQRFKEMEENGTLNDFYLNIKPIINGNDLPFEPCCYITSRWIPNEITEKWLDVNGFPTVPVISVGNNESKVVAAKEMNVEIFIDDSYENFIELNKSGIFTYLFTASHNQRYNVGHMRLNNLNDLPFLNLTKTKQKDNINELLLMLKK